VERRGGHTFGWRRTRIKTIYFKYGLREKSRIGRGKRNEGDEWATEPADLSKRNWENQSQTYRKRTYLLSRQKRRTKKNSLGPASLIFTTYITQKKKNIN